MKKILTVIISVAAAMFLGSCMSNNPLSPSSPFFNNEIYYQYAKPKYVFYNSSIGGTGTGDLYRANASDGSGAKLIIPTNTYVGGSASYYYSLDEKYVFVKGQKTGDNYTNIYRYNSDGTGCVNVVPGNASTVYSFKGVFPDNSFLVEEYVSSVSDKFYLYSFDGVRGELVATAPTNVNMALYGFHLAKNGQKIIYYQKTSDGITNVYLFKKYETTTKKTIESIAVTNYVSSMFYTILSPDGKTIFYFYLPYDIMMGKFASWYIFTSFDTDTFKKGYGAGCETNEFQNPQEISWDASPYPMYLCQYGSPMVYEYGVFTLSSAYPVGVANGGIWITRKTIPASNITQGINRLGYDAFGGYYLISKTNLDNPGVPERIK